MQVESTLAIGISSDNSTFPVLQQEADDSSDWLHPFPNRDMLSLIGWSTFLPRLSLARF